MRNLIYVDTEKLQQLDRRFYPDEYIAGKSAEYEVGLTFAVPSVKGKQTSRYRPPTVFEQIDRVRAALKNAGELSGSRPKPIRSRDVELHYIEERLTAYFSCLPAGPLDDPRSRPLTFWYVPATTVFGALVLLQDTRVPIEPLKHPILYSGYAVLQSLLYHARPQIDRSRLGSFFPKVAPREHAKVDDTHTESLIEEGPSAREHSVEFAKRAHELLREWGLPPTGPHHINALYWVRECGEEDTLDRRVSVFGYPVAVERASVRVQRSE